MFCPFAKEECRNDCAFRCRRRAVSQSMEESTTTCVIAASLDAINTEQADQLSELIDAVNNIS